MCHDKSFMVPPCFVRFPLNQWSMSQLCSEPCHCSSHPAPCHLRSWAQAARLFSMSLWWDLLIAIFVLYIEITVMIMTNVLDQVKVCMTCVVFIILHVDLCHLDPRGSWWFPAPAPNVLSSCRCLWGQLHDRHWKHASDHIRHWEVERGTALPHGILLCPAPHLP